MIRRKSKYNMEIKRVQVFTLALYLLHHLVLMYSLGSKKRRQRHSDTGGSLGWSGKGFEAHHTNFAGNDAEESSEDEFGFEIHIKSKLS